MKIWGQWYEEELFSFITYKNNTYRFYHWEDTNEAVTNYMGNEIHRHSCVKFYIELIF